MILDSLSICPGCLHHLRFDQDAARRQAASREALRVEGTVRHPGQEGPWEYHVVLSVRNDRGEEISRQVMNVGALHSGEQRSFAVCVEVLPQVPPVASKPPAPPSEPPPLAEEAAKPKVGGYDLKPPGLKPKKS
jgi:hypothetical protein